MSQTTKWALSQSLKSLLLKKPLSKITIGDITEECGINRMTFYYHFKDIYDLIEWTCEEEGRRALAEKKTYENWQEGFLNIFHLVEENRPFVLNVYRSISREHLESFLYRLTNDLIMGIVEEKAVGLSTRQEDRQFIVDFYKYAFVGLMLNWIKNDMKERPEDIVQRLSVLIQGDMERALKKMADSPPPD